jgi:hypothetical protein
VKTEVGSSSDYYYYYPIQLFIIYASSEQLQGQLQRQHSADIANYIMDRHNIKSRVNYGDTLMRKNKRR